MSSTTRTADGELVTITMDLSLDDCKDESYLEFLAKVHEQAPDVKVSVRNAHGPGNGIPEFELTGPYDQLRHVLITSWNLSSPEAEDYLASPGAKWLKDVKAKAAQNGWNAPESEALHVHIVSGSFYDKFLSDANLWNRYQQFKVERLTTDKLDEFLNDNAEGHAYLLGHEPADVANPALDGYEVIQVVFTGGRDWVVILGNVGP